MPCPLICEPIVASAAITAGAARNPEFQQRIIGPAGQERPSPVARTTVYSLLPSGPRRHPVGQTCPALGDRTCDWPKLKLSSPPLKVAIRNTATSLKITRSKLESPLKVALLNLALLLKMASVNPAKSLKVASENPASPLKVTPLLTYACARNIRA